MQILLFVLHGNAVLKSCRLKEYKSRKLWDATGWEGKTLRNGKSINLYCKKRKQESIKTQSPMYNSGTEQDRDFGFSISRMIVWCMGRISLQKLAWSSWESSLWDWIFFKVLPSIMSIRGDRWDTTTAWLGEIKKKKTGVYDDKIPHILYFIY